MTDITTGKPAKPRRRLALGLGAAAVLAAGAATLGAGTVFGQGGGERSWYERGGPSGWGGHGGWRSGGWHGGTLMGFGPERMIERALSSVGATSEQKLRIIQIAQGAMNDLRPLRDRRRQLALKIAILLKADTVDRAAFERLRAEEFQAFEEGSRRATQALVEVAEVLNAQQRQALVERWENRYRR